MTVQEMIWELEQIPLDQRHRSVAMESCLCEGRAGRPRIHTLEGYDVVIIPMVEEAAYRRWARKC